MQNVVDSLQHAFQMSGGSVGFSGLYLAGIIALWYTKYSKKKEAGYVFWYAICTTILVINPLTLFLVSKYFLKYREDNYYLWMMPIAPVIVYVVVMNLENIKTKLQRGFFLTGIVVLLLLAAVTSYTGWETKRIENDLYLKDEEKKVCDILSLYLEETGEDDLLLWGSQEIMAAARVADGRFYTLYGRDLWEGRADAEFTHVYEEKSYDRFNSMLFPKENRVQIVIDAINDRCDVLVFRMKDLAETEEEIPTSLEEVFYLYGMTKEYLVYVR